MPITECKEADVYHYHVISNVLSNYDFVLEVFYTLSLPHATTTTTTSCLITSFHFLTLGLHCSLVCLPVVWKEGPLMLIFTSTDSLDNSCCNLVLKKWYRGRNTNHKIVYSISVHISLCVQELCFMQCYNLVIIGWLLWHFSNRKRAVLCSIQCGNAKW